VSTVRVVFGAFIGHEGKNVQLVEGDEWESDHPVVVARPELFAWHVPGPVRAVQTVGPIEEADPQPLAEGASTSGMTTESGPPARRPRARKGA
jgi:hypothetical protein